MPGRSMHRACTRRSSLGLLVSIAWLLPVTAFAQDPPLRIGFSDSPPISFRDSKTGDLDGLAVALFRRVAAEANLDTQFQLMSFGALLTGLVENRLDVVTMSGTPDRRKVAVFSKPFARYSETLLVRSDDSRAYKSLEDLRGLHVGSNAGGGWIAAAEKAGAQVETFSGAEESLTALETGKVQAVVGNAPTYAYLLRGGSFPHVKMSTTYVPQQTNELAFGLRIADQALLARIETALDALDSNGTTARLRSEWGF